MRSAAKNRAWLQHALEGADMWASSGLLRSKKVPEVDKAALRSVMVGSSVTEARAAKWQHHDGACPACGELETAEHKFWQCPAKAARRAQVLEDWTPAQLQAILPAGALLTGILPRCPRDEAWARKAAEVAQLPPRSRPVPCVLDGR